MNIDHSRELLYDYARGRLSDKDRSIVEKELQSSRELRQELEKVKSYYTALDEIEPVPVADHFLEKVHQRIDQQGKRGLLNRLLFPLHLKLPIEFAGVVATVVLVIFIFIPQLDKKNYSEFKPAAIDNVQQEPASSQEETAGQPLTTVSAAREPVEMERASSAKKEVSGTKDERVVAPSKPQPKSSVAKAVKRSPMASAEVKYADQMESESPVSEQLSDNTPVPASVPPPAPKSAQQSIPENSAAGVSEQTPAMPSAAPEPQFQNLYSASEEQTPERNRKMVTVEKKRMKSRSAYAEQYDRKEMAAASDVETAAVPEEIAVLLAKCAMNWIVKESRRDVRYYSASGTPAAVTTFLREVSKRSDITIRKVVPEDYSAAVDSVIVEFSVKVRGD